MTMKNYNNIASIRIIMLLLVLWKINSNGFEIFKILVNCSVFKCNGSWNQPNVECNIELSKTLQSKWIKETDQQTDTIKMSVFFSSCISDIRNTRWIILMIIIYEMNWNCIEFSVCVAKLKGKIFTQTFNNNYGVDCVIWVIGCVGV